MATLKPRVTVTLSEPLNTTLRALTAATGQSISGLICEILESSEPILKRMAETFAHVKAMTDQQRERFKQAMEDAEDTFSPLASQVVGQFDIFASNLEEAAAPTGRGAQRLPGGAVSSPKSNAKNSKTPLTNRGVTPRGGKGEKLSTVKALSKKSAITHKKKVSSKKRGSRV